MPHASDALTLRPIRSDDDTVVAQIIRTVMTEFGATGCGFAIEDAEVDTMSSTYGAPGHAYFVLEAPSGKVVGGGGVGPLAGGEAGVCELRKMYFLPEARGLGAGRRLLTACLDQARELEFHTCYLETLRSMDGARKLYERFGFERLDAPLGATGHGSCDAWYALAL